MLIDRIGFLGVAVREISLGRVAGAVLLLGRSAARPALLMRVDLFDFDLPEERIALRPAEPRDGARMLVVKPGEALDDRTVRDLPSLLRAGDVLVFNDTKVIPAQLKGIRRRGEAQAQVEATLHMRMAPDRWLAFMRPGKRLAAGDRIHFRP